MSDINFTFGKITSNRGENKDKTNQIGGFPKIDLL